MLVLSQAGSATACRNGTPVDGDKDAGVGVFDELELRDDGDDEEGCWCG